MNRFKTFLPLVCIALLMAACAVSDGLPKLQGWPQWRSAETQWFKLESLDVDGNVRQTSLLAVQPEQDSLRFVQTDTLGAPLSRQILSRKGWQNDGFVAPNAESRRLFAAMLPLLAAPGQTVYTQQTDTLWQRAVSDGHTQIRFDNGRQWRISPLQP